MNLELLIEQLINDTYSGIIHWDIDNISHYIDKILQYKFVFRMYSSVYKDAYKILFVEKKFPDFTSDWGEDAEVFFPEVIFLDTSNNIVSSIDQNVVNRDKLLQLAGAIENNNNALTELFGFFNQKK